MARLAFFGMPLGALALLREGFALELAVLSPVPSVGRRRLRRRLRPGALLEAAQVDSHNVRVKAALSQADLLVSWFWTRKLPADWLRLPRLGALGAHPSLLPRHRGPDPYFWTIDSGDQETGVSIHRLEPEYDTGAILARRAIPVAGHDAGSLARELDVLSLRLLCDTIWKHLRGESRAIEQDPALATWAPRPRNHQLHVQWQWDRERILRRLRALSPVPGLLTEVRGRRLLLARASASSLGTEHIGAGEAAIIGQPPMLHIGTGTGPIRIERAFLCRDDGSVFELSRAALADLFEGRQTLGSEPAHDRVPPKPSWSE